MGYVVLHINKASGNDAGTTAHIERTIVPKNVDPSRTHLNKDLIKYPDGVETRTQAIQHRIENAGITRKIGTNQVRALRVMLSGTHEDMRRIEAAGQLDEWCENNMKWLRGTFGADNIVSATLHRDEKTPHIHATVVPIVTGERRKAAKERKKREQAQSEGQTSPQAGKKKYRKKNTAAPRLCADDVMTRDNLERFQDTYAEKMSKYGLQRGIKGSEAKHITNVEFHRHIVTHKAELQAEIKDLQETKEARQQEVAEHEQQALQAHARAKEATAEKQQAETELAGKQSELKQVKGELKTEKLKSTAAEVGSNIIEGIGSVIGTSKVKRQQQEIDTLKAESAGLTMQLGYRDKTIQNLQREHRNEIERLNQSHETEANKLRQTHKTDIANYQQQIESVARWFPHIPQMAQTADYCRDIGFSIEQTNELLKLNPVQYTGRLRSPKTNNSYDADNVTARLERLPGEPSLILTINGVSIVQWFKQKLEELKQATRQHIKPPPKPKMDDRKDIKI